jgi:hypothetical protein
MKSPSVQQLTVGTFALIALMIPMLILARTQPARTEAKLPVVSGVEAQPLLAQAARLKDALAFLGEPLSESSQKKLQEADGATDPSTAARLVQEALDPICIAAIRLPKSEQPSVVVSTTHPKLVEQGWRIVLIKVINEGGVTLPLRMRSPNALPIAEAPAADVGKRWLDLAVFDNPPLLPALSGLGLEYRIVQLYSRSAGPHTATLLFKATEEGARPPRPNARAQDAAGWTSANIDFDCLPSHPVKFHVTDTDGKPGMAAFVIRDARGRVYPPQVKRLAPDLHFQPQVYRADGETVRLPAGTFTVSCSRGPESIPETRTLTVGAAPATFSYRVARWVDPSKLGWWSGDHHIHAAGCAHYTNPTEGVLPKDMQRHIEGEDLKVGCNLTWGPCFDYQKQFFTGALEKVSRYPYLLRYDIEVSGFGSHQSGHVCLLRLKDQIPPGGTSKDHWPTLCLNTLRWAKKQGAVCGPAHSANGLAGSVARVAEMDGPNGLPTYAVPRFDGIGAMETIVDVTHELPGPTGSPVPAVDFISTMDTDRIAELNIWYHILNCGYRTRISGETDFPCITGDRVGRGRSYVKLKGKLDFDTWCQGVHDGKCYVSDGQSHLMDFKVDGLEVGDKQSEVRLSAPGTVHVTVKCAARQLEGVQRLPQQVEVVVNGYPVSQQDLTPDGRTRDLKFDIPIAKSSWVALRVLGSSHTNPIFVIVDGKPIRASKRSAEWCLASVEQCWKQKERFIAPAEHEDAVRAYDHAREAYRRLISETAGE